LVLITLATSRESLCNIQH